MYAGCEIYANGQTVFKMGLQALGGLPQVPRHVTWGQIFRTANLYANEVLAVLWDDCDSERNAHVQTCDRVWDWRGPSE